MSEVLKLSSPATREFWEIPIVYEDESLLAFNKPVGLLTSPDRHDAHRPSLMQLLHRDIKRGAAWATARNLSYLMNVHRLDAETSGIVVMARNKAVFIAVANLFGTEKPTRRYVALAFGHPKEDEFRVDAKIAPDPLRPGNMRVNSRAGKKASTEFRVLTRFKGCTLIECKPATERLHQIRVHLKHLRLPVLGDSSYGGPPLLLSRLKRDYRLKKGRIERPLISQPAVHLEEVSFSHPLTSAQVTMTAGWPKDLTVAVKYLRLYAAG